MKLKLSKNCQFVSMRPRGTEVFAPRVANPSTLISGKPKSCVLVPMFRPIELGSNVLSSGKKFSAKRLYPPRISITARGLKKCVYETEGIFMVVGGTEL